MYLLWLIIDIIQSWGSVNCF
uniref:Uncharacterized protein n=1 Tax=Rhizophora mucronata TaxID=61149 RepID=A0A2P2L482_RHIMU